VNSLKLLSVYAERDPGRLGKELSATPEGFKLGSVLVRAAMVAVAAVAGGC
jgi:hypothetical protein